MAKQSNIAKSIRELVHTGRLTTQFKVKDIQNISDIINDSPSFISKHAIGNPGNYTPYFRRVSIGKYELNPAFNNIH